MIQRKGTKQLIAESFMELVRERGVRNVTVGDVAANCGISPRTFYYHFTDKFALLEYVHETAIRSAVEHWGDFRNLLLESTYIIAERGSYAINATEFVQGVPNPIERMARRNTAVYRDIIIEHGFNGDFTERLESILYYYNFMVVKMLTDWEAAGENIPNEELVDRIMAFMPAELDPLLNSELFKNDSGEQKAAD